MNIKPTASQLTMLHAGESALASASLTVGAGVYQYITSQSLNFPALLAFLGATFLGAMAMIYKSLLANPALPQAESDTENQVVGFLSNEFAQFVGGHFKALETAIANHSHTPLATPSAPSQVPQLAFPVPGTAATGGNVVQLTNAGVPFSGATTTNVPVQPQAPMLGTIPTLQAVQQ